MWIGNYFNVKDEYKLEKYDESEEENGKILDKKSVDNRNLMINTGKYLSEIIDGLYYLKILKLKSIIPKSSFI